MYLIRPELIEWEAEQLLLLPLWQLTLLALLVIAAITVFVVCFVWYLRNGDISDD